MKISALKLFFVTAITMGAFSAKAGLLLEPYLGYQSTTIQADIKGGGEGKGSATSTNLGLRLGYKLPVMFWVAADYNMSMSGKFSADSGSAFGDSDFDQSRLYLDVGVDFPILIRAWAGYGLMNSVKLKPDNGAADSTFSGGSSYKLGVGFTGLPFVSINFEYINESPNKFEQGGTSAGFDDVFDDYKNSGYMLSVSLPLNL